MHLHIKNIKKVSNMRLTFLKIKYEKATASKEVTYHTLQDAIICFKMLIPRRLGKKRAALVGLRLGLT